MSWSEIGKNVADFAPVLGAALGGPAGGAVGTLLASLFGSADDPAAVKDAMTRDPESAAKISALELEHHAELTRMVLAAETTRLAEVNATMRAEYAQEDKYVKRWRPTFGYAVTLTWTIQCAGIVGGLLYAIVYHPEQSANILTAIGAIVGALSLQWGVALSVLGVAVSKRSDDKQVAAGQVPSPGIIGALAQRISNNPN